MTAKRILVGSGALLALLLLGASALLIGFNTMLQPVDSEAVDQLVLVEIPQGSSTGQIASILVDEQVTRNALVFRAYARWKGLDQKFIAGAYHLSPSMGLSEIAAKLTGGDVYRETEWFTIPEGFTVEQIADRLESEGLADRERFLELASDPPENFYERFPFIAEIDHAWTAGITEDAWQRSYLPILLEGYLFPDTYEISAGASEDEIITMMLRHLDTVFNGELRRRGDELGMTMHEVLTLASIVEKESGVPADREPIAGVFHNRLAVNHALESCATVNFFLNIDIEVLLLWQRDIPSPHNTYLNTGLSPGPIAAPGEAAIRAALYPAENNYFFFNSKGDGTGESYFARTPAEHSQNVVKMEANIRNRN